MTGPLGAGYRDWARSFATSRFWQLPYFVTTITGSSVAGIFTTVNIDSLGVRLFALTGGGELVLDWFADQALTQFVTTDTLNMLGGDTFDQSVVVKGAFLRVTATPVPASNWTLTLVLYETTRSVIPQTTSRANVLIRQLGTAVGASTFVEVESGRVWPGEVYWLAGSALATWSAELRHVDHLGGVRTIDVIRSTDAVQNHNLYLAAEHSRIRFTNSTAVAGTFDTFLIARPGLSGF